nr:MAG TPA: hypothetical protein [Bacteriophage sp.]
MWVNTQDLKMMIELLNLFCYNVNCLNYMCS